FLDRFHQQLTQVTSVQRPQQVFQRDISYPLALVLAERHRFDHVRFSRLGVYSLIATKPDACLFANASPWLFQILAVLHPSSVRSAPRTTRATRHISWSTGSPPSRRACSLTSAPLQLHAEGRRAGFGYARPAAAPPLSVLAAVKLLQPLPDTQLVVQVLHVDPVRA